jgi:hypothetical protein
VHEIEPPLVEEFFEQEGNKPLGLMFKVLVDVQIAQDSGGVIRIGAFGAQEERHEWKLVKLRHLLWNVQGGESKLDKPHSHLQENLTEQILFLP